MPIAIGGAIAGILLGFCLEIVIKTEYPDGTVLTASLPPASKVTLGDSGAGVQNAEAQEAAPADETATGPSDTFSPLTFAILVEQANFTDGKSLESAKRELIQSEQDGAVATEFGTWYPVALEVSVPTEATHRDQRYALARNDRQGRVRWKEITGHLSAISSHASDAQGAAIEFGFDDDLAKRVRELTKNNLRQRLAIILDGRVISTPQIMSELGRRARITGNFSDQEIEFLMGALNGLLVEPSQPGPSEEASGQEADVDADASEATTQPQQGVDSGPTDLFQGIWRIAILPFIEHQELYEQYRFDEPWDSEHNSTLLSKMPEVYRSPSWEQAGSVHPVGETHYQGFVGEHTALGTDDGVALREITDGTSPTLWIAETRATVPWTKPQDLSFEKAEDAGNVTPFENQPLYYLTADGAVHSMDPVDREKLSKLITRDGGERVQP